MTTQRPLWALVACLACWPYSSYCEPFTYGTTGNAAVNGLSWSMGALVPSAPGLSINGVIYRYTTVKDPDAAMLVHLQNEDAEGEGYIFRETDDWTGLPGNTINKLIAINNIPISRWGDGSIEVEGEGEVVDPTLVYTYQIDECFNPQANPICPGYVDPSQFLTDQNIVDPYDPMEDEAVMDSMKPTNPELYEEEETDETIEPEKEKAIRDTFEKGLAAAQNALTLANSISQDMIISSMNTPVNMYSYYTVNISGGVYRETAKLEDADLPKNPRGLRNGLAQQLLHEKMVDAQYENLEF